MERREWHLDHFPRLLDLHKNLLVNHESNNHVNRLSEMRGKFTIREKKILSYNT